MNITALTSFWVTLIEVPIEKIYDFIIIDSATSRYHVLYNHFEVDKFYIDNLYEKSALEFYGAIFYNPITDPSKTIVIGNAGSWGTLSNYICKKLLSRNYQIDMNDEESNTLRNSLMVNDSGESIRFVQSLYSKDEDNKWIFTEKGPPQWFENIEFYKRPEINERLNKIILEEYCYKLGLFINDADFFRSKEKSLFIKYEIPKRNK